MQAMEGLKQVQIIGESEVSIEGVLCSALETFLGI